MTGVQALAQVLGVRLEAVSTYLMHLHVDDSHPYQEVRMTPRRSSSVKTVLIPSISGWPIAIPYINTVDCSQPSESWVFLWTNRQAGQVTASAPQIACSCPSSSDCSDPRLCPCARFAVERNPTRGGFYTNFMGRKRLKTAGFTDTRVYECGYECHCNKSECRLTFLNGTCGNLVNPPLAIMRKQTGNEGLWVLTTQHDIEEGEFVMEITGEIIAKPGQSERRESLIPLGTGEDCMYLDYGHMGNLGRFLRYSEVPCLTLARVCVEHKDPRICRLVLFAMRKIPAFETLTVKTVGFHELETS